MVVRRRGVVTFSISHDEQKAESSRLYIGKPARERTGNSETVNHRRSLGLFLNLLRQGRKKSGIL